jgi:hypothetical protein
MQIDKNGHIIDAQRRKSRLLCSYRLRYSRILTFFACCSGSSIHNRQCGNLDPAGMDNKGVRARPVGNLGGLI